jgi:predicted nucleic acid-binding protein
MARKAVLLDTSFFLRFLNDSDPLFKHADDYFRYFIEKEITMMISTISIAEYCVGGSASELPLKNLQILPFNFKHAERAGAFARIVFRNKNKLKLSERNIIPNDTKLFAQADSESAIEFYLSSDSESQKVYNLLKQTDAPKFQFIDLKIPCRETFGYLF